jgi:hypothetical protein
MTFNNDLPGYCEVIIKEIQCKVLIAIKGANKLPINDKS